MFFSVDKVFESSLQIIEWLDESTPSLPIQSAEAGSVDSAAIRKIVVRLIDNHLLDAEPGLSDGQYDKVIPGAVAAVLEYAALSASKGDGWVRVEDGLPEGQDDYEVWVKGCTIPLVAHFNSKEYFKENYDQEDYMEEGWYFSFDYRRSMGGEGPVEVTHWRPLPAPPQTKL